MTTRQNATGSAFWGDIEDDDVALHRHRSLVHAVDDGLFHLDADGHFVAVNEALLEITGYAREALLGERISQALAEDAVEQVEHAIGVAVEGDDTLSPFEVDVRTADGRTVPLELQISPLSADDGAGGCVGVARDRRESTAPAKREAAPEQSAARDPAQERLDDTAREAAGDHTAEQPAAGEDRQHPAIADTPEQPTAVDAVLPPSESVSSLLDEADIGVFVLDDEFDIAWVDETIERYFGLDRTELLGRDTRETIEETIKRRVADPEAFAERVLSTYDDNNYVEQFECRVRASEDEEWRWLEHISRPIESGPYAGGRIELYYDVTDRKASQDALHTARTQLESLIDAVQEYAIFRMDTEGHIVSWNEGAEQMKGYDREEIVGEHFSKLYTEADRADGVPDANLERAADDGSYENEALRVRKDGTRFRAKVTITALQDDDGNPQGFLKVTRDVTDRIQRERALAESEQRYRTLVEHFPNGAVALFDEDLEYTAAGGEVLEEIGTSADEIVGETVWERYPEDVAEQLAPRFRAAVEDGEPDEFDVEFHDRHWHAYTLPLTDDDSEPFAGVTMFQDVTERKEYQRKLEASNQRLEQFASTASHDLQEPLRVISSYLQLLERRYDDDLDEDAREFVEFAVDAADRMRGMIEGLLEYARVETGGDPFEPVDLDEVFEDAERDLAVRIEESDADVTAASLPRVRGDPGQLRQVFQNLLSNAIEYSGDEPPEIEVGAERDGEAWIVSVRDQGVGIASDEDERIFEVFERLHSQEQHQGTGIGLALCQRIVERHGGELWVESEPDEGSTFSFRLPAVE